jgi:hypothetical protein
VLQYFDGCPSWREAETLLREALAEVGATDVIVERQKVETLEAAVAVGFTGSPTLEQLMAVLRA